MAVTETTARESVAETQLPALVRGSDDHDDDEREAKKRRKKAKKRRKLRITTREVDFNQRGGAYEATILCEGAGNSRDANWYTKQALRQAVSDGMFDGLKAYLNHPSASEERERPERDVRFLAGHFKEARYVEDGGRGRVVAKFVPGGMDKQRVVDLIESALDSPADKPLIGISIDGYGATDGTQEIGGRTYNMVREIAHLGSADLVTATATGGQFNKRLSESLAGARGAVGDPVTMSASKLQRRVQKALRRLERGLGAEDDEKVREAFVALHEAASAILEPPAVALREVETRLAGSEQRADEAEVRLAAAERKLKRQRRKRKLAEAEAERAASELARLRETAARSGYGQVEGAGPRPFGPFGTAHGYGESGGLLSRMGITPEELER